MLCDGAIAVDVLCAELILPTPLEPPPPPGPTDDAAAVDIPT